MAQESIEFTDSFRHVRGRARDRTGDDDNHRDDRRAMEKRRQRGTGLLGKATRNSMRVYRPRRAI